MLHVHLSPPRAVAAAVLTLALTGCRVDNHRGHDGHHVSIETPLGGLNVKTDTPGVLSKIGLPTYPGALEDRKKDDDNGSADVDINFGNFRLRVLAAGYTTHDSPERVRLFYLKQMAQFGDVLECRNEQPIGNLRKTGQGLTCASDNHVHGQTDTHTGSHSGNEIELKAGSPTRQHIVSLEPQDGGTHFGLVSLELPHGLGDS